MTATSAVVVPHFALPFRFTAAGADVVEQDTLDDVAQCVEALLRTREGQRIDLLSYGVADLVFDTVIDVPGIIAEITQWEPRASVNLNDDIDVTDDMIRTIRARVSLADHENDGD